MKSSVFYKLLIVVLAILLVLGGAYAGKTIHDTQLQVEHFRNDEKKIKDQLDDVNSQLAKYQEFLQRMETDPSFLDWVARERLNYAKPDELIFRFDVDPLTGASTGNLDNARLPANAPATGSSQPATSPRHN